MQTRHQFIFDTLHSVSKLAHLLEHDDLLRAVQVAETAVLDDICGIFNPSVCRGSIASVENLVLYLAEIKAEVESDHCERKNQI